MYITPSKILLKPRLSTGMGRYFNTVPTCTFTPTGQTVVNVGLFSMHHLCSHLTAFQLANMERASYSLSEGTESRPREVTD